jgi:hypothetical protein
MMDTEVKPYKPPGYQDALRVGGDFAIPMMIGEMPEVLKTLASQSRLQMIKNLENRVPSTTLELQRSVGGLGGEEVDQVRKGATFGGIQGVAQGQIQAKLQLQQLVDKLLQQLGMANPNPDVTTNRPPGWMGAAQLGTQLISGGVGMAAAG